MTFIDFIPIIAIVLIVGAATLYIIRAKKRGDKCVGCPYAKQCGSKCSCSTSAPKKDGNRAPSDGGTIRDEG